MSDIFREVEEDVRREQLKRLWDRFGIYVVLAAVLIVAVTAGWRAWQWYSARQAAAAGETYHQALELARGDAHQEAYTALEAIAEEGGPFAGLARLRAAAELARAGDRDRAVAAYDEIIADSAAGPQLRDAARIRVGYLLIGAADQAAIEERVGELASGDGPWRHSARELLGIAAYRAGDLAAAGERFQQILADPATPQALRGRAQVMISLIAAQSPAGGEQAASAEDGAEGQ